MAPDGSCAQRCLHHVRGGPGRTCDVVYVVDLTTTVEVAPNRSLAQRSHRLCILLMRVLTTTFEVAPYGSYAQRTNVPVGYTRGCSTHTKYLCGTCPCEKYLYFFLDGSWPYCRRRISFFGQATVAEALVEGLTDIYIYATRSKPLMGLTHVVWSAPW